VQSKAKILLSKAKEAQLGKVAFQVFSSVLILTIIGQFIGTVAVNRYEEARQKQRAKGQKPTQATMIVWLLLIIGFVYLYFEYQNNNKKQ
jgi:ABC-type sugar transport system permease subunit